MLRFILSSFVLFVICGYCTAQHEPYSPYTENGKHGLLRKDKSVLIPAVYENVLNVPSLLNYNLLHVIKDGKHGFVDSLNQSVLATVYDYIQFPEGENKPSFHACLLGNKWGMIDPKGKLIIPAKFDFIEGRPDLLGNFQVWSLGYFGLYSATGQELLPPVCEEVRYFSMPMSWYLAKKSTGAGIIDREGNVVVDFDYDDITRISKKGKKMLMKRSGEIFTLKENNVLDFQNSTLYTYPENSPLHYCVQSETTGKNSVYYAQKNDGTILEHTRSDGIVYPGEHGMFINRNSKWYFTPIHANTNLKDTSGFDQVVAFGEGLFKVKQKDLFGLLNDKGEIVQPTIFHNLYKTEQLQLHSCKNSTTFIIGRLSKTQEKLNLVLIHPSGKVIAQNIERIRFFAGEYSEFLIKGDYFACDEFGHLSYLPSIHSPNIAQRFEFIQRLVFREIQSKTESYILGKNKRYDLYNRHIDTNHIPRFDSIIPLYYRASFLFYPIDNPEYFIVRNQGKFGLLDQFGKLVFPCEYLQIIARNTYVYGSSNVLFSGKDMELQHVLLKNEKGWSIGNVKGQIITKSYYEDFQTDENIPSVCLKRSGKWFILSATGNEIPMAPIKSIIPCWDCNRTDVWDL